MYMKAAQLSLATKLKREHMFHVVLVRPKMATVMKEKAEICPVESGSSVCSPLIVFR